MTIKRYSFVGWADTRHSYQEDPKGEWIKYEDHERIVKEMLDGIAEDIEALQEMERVRLLP